MSFGQISSLEALEPLRVYLRAWETTKNENKKQKARGR
jgi:hypothetical protein